MEWKKKKNLKAEKEVIKNYYAIILYYKNMVCICFWLFPLETQSMTCFSQIIFYSREPRVIVRVHVCVFVRADVNRMCLSVTSSSYSLSLMYSERGK